MIEADTENGNESRFRVDLQASDLERLSRLRAQQSRQAALDQVFASFRVR